VSSPERAIPRATYRLQLHSGFQFQDAAAVSDYLAQLGVSHAYTSPVLAAVPGSTHGYDVVDHARVNPELGGDAALSVFEQALANNGLGWVLDIVPNHMAIHTPTNRAFWDVLKHGQASEDATMFDIDWDAPTPELNGRVMLPILGRELDAVIADGELKLVEEDGETVLTYYDHRMPLAPGSLPDPAGQAIEQCNRDPDAMRALVDRQHYRPVFWKRACTQINYRRFFSINSLIGLRVEDRAVFERVHALPLAWAKAGRLHGLRVDHPDGLRDPRGYLEQLRDAAPDCWRVVEKILEPEERLPSDWPVHGTTGYDTLNVVSGLFVDPDAEPAMTRTYAESTGRQEPFETVAQEGKRFVLCEDFGGEIDRLARMLRTAGLDEQTARQALIELVVHWPVYRVYPDALLRKLSGTGLERVRLAIRDASADSDTDPAVWTALQRRLTLEDDSDAAMDFAIRFQQLASAATAKGVEDTAFYRDHRLVALNEVGGDPGRFGTPPKHFHDFFRHIARDWPATMVATTTHDTKRSEDARLRIAMLSQMPRRWAEAVRHWMQISDELSEAQPMPSRDDLYLLYQTLVGTWPIPTKRLQDYMLKAAREAKRQTNWIDQDARYEAALAQAIETITSDQRFVDSLESLLADLLPAARLSSLSQTLIKLTVPGVPDLYQGCELWDESLVDPDNRRPVDYDQRRRLLDGLDAMSARQIVERMQEGLPKLWVTRQALAARKAYPDCFGPGGAYTAVHVEGARPEAVVAYRRGDRALVVAPRRTIDLDAWSGQTTVAIPAGRWRDAMTGRNIETSQPLSISVAELWNEFPVCLMIEQASKP